MTTVLVLQTRNLRLKYFPKVIVLLPAELICSNSVPLASTHSEPPRSSPPSSLGPAGTFWAGHCFPGQIPQSHFSSLKKSDVAEVCVLCAPKPHVKPPSLS